MYILTDVIIVYGRRLVLEIIDRKCSRFYGQTLIFVTFNIEYCIIRRNRTIARKLKKKKNILLQFSRVVADIA